MTGPAEWFHHIESHPAAEVFRPLEGAEWEAFLADVRENGVDTPVVTTAGSGEGPPLLVDGRQRIRAAIEAGLKFVPRRVLPFKADPVRAALRLNNMRRHDSIDDRARAADAISALSTAGGDRRSKDHSAPGQNDRPVTQKEAAREMGVSVRQVARAAKVRKEGSPELQQKVKAGEVSLREAEEIISDTPAVPAREVVEAPAPEEEVGKLPVARKDAESLAPWIDRLKPLAEKVEGCSYLENEAEQQYEAVKEHWERQVTAARAEAKRIVAEAKAAQKAALEKVLESTGWGEKLDALEKAEAAMEAVYEAAAQAGVDRFALEDHFQNRGMG